MEQFNSDDFITYEKFSDDILFDRPFKINNDDRFFKRCLLNDCNYYVYGYLKRYQTGKNEIVFRMDYEQARKLASHFDIEIKYSKIVHIVKDNIFLSPSSKNSLKNWYGIWGQTGYRYIAEALASYPSDFGNKESKRKEMLRIGSAGMDNVHASFISYCPNMATKRAIIKLVLDILQIDNIVEDFYETPPQEATATSNKKEQSKKKNEKMEKLQLTMIKKLLKQNGKKFLKKYEKFTKDDAAELINQLKEKK